ncbi:hypothetical protein FB451DRAFT_1365531 [Mycena latifolia]|nr:hypothetical protein FB451DRAFT_1365531 [Mycena latifolia]
MRGFLFLCTILLLYSQVVPAGADIHVIGATDQSIDYHATPSTLTGGNITIPFTGNGIEVYLRISSGVCTFSIDGTQVGTYSNTSSVLRNTQKAYSNASIPNGHHVLLISRIADPNVPDGMIEFEQVLVGRDIDVRANSSTVTGHSVNVRAIVGGVVGSVLFIACLIIGVYVFRRRRRTGKLARS